MHIQIFLSSHVHLFQFDQQTLACLICTLTSLQYTHHDALHFFALQNAGFSSLSDRVCASRCTLLLVRLCNQKFFESSPLNIGWGSQRIIVVILSVTENSRINIPSLLEYLKNLECCPYRNIQPFRAYTWVWPELNQGSRSACILLGSA